MQLIKEYIKENSTLLFEYLENNELLAVFDSRGFFFTEESKSVYGQIRDKPHVYVAWSEDSNYVGKSFQKGGRWKRSHAYHLGTLAHHLLNTIRYDDQNHAHWIERWMHAQSKVAINETHYSIKLKSPVYICFIPFDLYVNQYPLASGRPDLEKNEIRKINTDFERRLINSIKDDNDNLLNVQHN